MSRHSCVYYPHLSHSSVVTKLAGSDFYWLCEKVKHIEIEKQLFAGEYI